MRRQNVKWMKLRALLVMLDPVSKLLGDTRAVGKKEREREQGWCVRRREQVLGELTGRSEFSYLLICSHPLALSMWIRSWSASCCHGVARWNCLLPTPNVRQSSVFGAYTAVFGVWKFNPRYVGAFSFSVKKNQLLNPFDTSRQVMYGGVIWQLPIAVDRCSFVLFYDVDFSMWVFCLWRRLPRLY